MENPQEKLQKQPIADLERRQDEVLRKLDELDSSILLLLDEFNARLAGSLGEIAGQEISRSKAAS